MMPAEMATRRLHSRVDTCYHVVFKTLELILQLFNLHIPKVVFVAK